MFDHFMDIVDVKTIGEAHEKIVVNRDENVPVCLAIAVEMYNAELIKMKAEWKRGKAGGYIAMDSGLMSDDDKNVVMLCIDLIDAILETITDKNALLDTVNIRTEAFKGPASIGAEIINRVRAEAEKQGRPLEPNARAERIFELDMAEYDMTVATIHAKYGPAYDTWEQDVTNLVDEYRQKRLHDFLFGKDGVLSGAVPNDFVEDESNRYKN